MWFAQGELERARTALERVLAMDANGLDVDLVADAEYTFGHVERAAGRQSAARQRFARSLDTFRALNLPAAAGKALVGLAAVTFATGEAAEAEQFLDEAALALRHAGPWFLSFTMCYRALLAVQAGRTDEALRWVRGSLVHIRDIADKFAFVYALVPLGAVAALKGNHAWAARILGVRDAVAERTGAALVDTSIHDLRARIEQEARGSLGAHRWATAYAAGRKSSIDALMKDIDRELAGRDLVRDARPET
jgi:tetratricopeptide (TPR) repeat protein